MRTMCIGLLVAVLVMGATTGLTSAQVPEDPEPEQVLAQSDLTFEPAGWLLAQALDPADLQRRLNLSDEQARRVRQILTAHQDRIARLRIALSRARLDAREAMLEATPDRTKLEGIARRIGELTGQLTAARFQTTLELRQVLTPEQWNRLRTLRARRWAPRPGRLR
ncbi:MAG: Spy/CpxP family protein refolding chaperone [Armatimonadota bacterium]|nr:Spy/CpxP family protein refolding chaperone [Armatimonadota bacterium]